MSRKIIGITVGTQLPKPDFKQTDPTKGDFIKNKPVEMTDDDALNLLSEVNIIDPVTNGNGAIFTNGNGAIFVL